MWYIEIAQKKTYESNGEKNSYFDKVTAEFATVEKALSFSEMTLKNMKDVRITVWHEESNMEEGE